MQIIETQFCFVTFDTFNHFTHFCTVHSKAPVFNACMNENESNREAIVRYLMENVSNLNVFQFNASKECIIEYVTYLLH